MAQPGSGLATDFHSLVLERGLFFPPTSTLSAHIPTSVFHPVGAALSAAKQKRIDTLCERVEQEYRALRWGKSPCRAVPWSFTRISERGYPLVYFEFNGLRSPKYQSGTDETTLVLGGVHPDELTPIHLAFRFAQELANNPEIFADRRVVVAPLVNPDGFFAKPYRRTNWNGVDLNRNFATSDWWANARKFWIGRRNADARHFPGRVPQSEEGTRFQSDLIDRFDADKVISVHSPLGFLDYDGPGDTKLYNLSAGEKRARELAHVVSRKTNNYSIRDYTFFPGSLGNYSGNERNIPTVTLELKSSDPRKVGRYWQEFSPGLISAVRYDFVKNLTAQLGSFPAALEKN
jgi:murein peptide amidase A